MKDDDGSGSTQQNKAVETTNENKEGESFIRFRLLRIIILLLLMGSVLQSQLVSMLMTSKCGVIKWDGVRYDVVGVGCMRSMMMMMMMMMMMVSYRSISIQC